jgi:anthranilate phosphoribosyltransferase
MVPPQHPHDWKLLAQRLASGQSLTEDQCFTLLSSILDGQMSTSDIASALTHIHHRGVTVDELVGGAKAMHARAVRVQVPSGKEHCVVDTCGTGGGPKAFNISTLSAIVCAAAGDGNVLVAKHGNRSRTGRGSAEILSALGVQVDASPAVQARCLENAHVCFCFAVHHHGAVKHAREARASLAFPTIFNALGPLTNPAGAGVQVMGVYDALLASKLASAMAKLGCAQGLTLHAANGMDELSLGCDTQVWSIHEPSSPFVITLDMLRSWGLEPSSVHDVQAQDLAHAVSLARSVLRNEQLPATQWVLASAAVTLATATTRFDANASTQLQALMPEAVDRCKLALARGDAARTLEALVATSHT